MEVAGRGYRVAGGKDETGDLRAEGLRDAVTCGELRLRGAERPTARTPPLHRRQGGSVVHSGEDVMDIGGPKPR